MLTSLKRHCPPRNNEVLLITTEVLNLTAEVSKPQFQPARSFFEFTP